jgi:hypothetical protein
MFRDTKGTARASAEGTRHDDAVFMGWQKMGSGEVLALYNVTAAGHPSLGSTVTGKSLLGLNLQVPRTPLPPGK